MANPFTIRATEYVKSNEAFLTLVAPDPVTLFLQPYARDAGLFRRLLAIQGTPGSGKTTIARLFEFSTLVALLRGTKNDSFSELIDPLQKCCAIKNDRIQILACRLPLESDYRELWQLPYSEKIRNELLQRLIQSRAIIAWFNQLFKAEIDPSDVFLEVRDGTQAALKCIGGQNGIEVLNRAKAVESGIYRIIGALLPPPETKIESEIIDPYSPFDVIDKFHLSTPAAQAIASEESLCPLVILDDAHFLHLTQLMHLKTWLIRRELTIARWILSRLDVLKPQELFESISGEDASVDMPGITAERDIIRINLQSGGRNGNRSKFRKMARDMSKKYLAQLKIFGQNGITELESILPDKVSPLSPSKCEDLQKSVTSIVRRLGVSDKRVKEFQQMAKEFLDVRSENYDDLRWAIVRILVHRYIKRTPQVALFPNEEGPDPSKPLQADNGVYDGARIHLLNEYDRPYYVGFDTLCDAASDNAEAFLRLSSHIVEASENMLIKQKSGTIQTREQHKLLVERAKSIVDSWSFPEHRRVRNVATCIAERCKARTLEPNAPLDHGANAYGIIQNNFMCISKDYPELAKIVKYSVAYNALTLIPNYECKGKTWCLLELGGISILKHGLPFKRGGFVEGSLEELNQALK